MKLENKLHAPQTQWCDRYRTEIPIQKGIGENEEVTGPTQGLSPAGEILLGSKARE